MGGACSGSNRKQETANRLIKANLSQVERSVLHGEDTIKLQTTWFLDFQKAIKRYGFKGELRDEGLQEVAGIIRLNWSEIDKE